MTDQRRVYLTAPIGHPLPIVQTTATPGDVVAWVHNYGKMWPQSEDEAIPSIERWSIERLERLGPTEHGSYHIVGLASVDGETDVMVVYDTNFRAQIWRMSRDKSDEMWPRLLVHAHENAPKPPSAPEPPVIAPELPLSDSLCQLWQNKWIIRLLVVVMVVSGILAVIETAMMPWR